MAEVLFYHLERRTLDDVLPGLVEKTLQRGWRGLILAESADRAQAIDSLLWTYADESFLPHAQAGDGDSARQPVLITTERANANNADVLFLVGGAAPPGWADTDIQELSRIVVMFDGRDAQAVESARGAWRAAKAASHDVTYWKESAAGKWEKQG